jgi:GDPmannose 4,6-dehydratase
MLNHKLLTLANIDSCRDWGHAKDYVRGMWLMLQQDSPGDFVLATGVAHSVQDFLNAAFEHLGITLR